MTALTPILYADGALRLTDHGPRGGGNVLVLVSTGEQCELSAEGAERIASVVENMNRHHATPAGLIFNHMRSWYPVKPRSPGYYHG